MKSYWQESVNKKEYRKIDRDTKTDICIIGGGMVRNSYCIYVNKSTDFV